MIDLHCHSNFSDGAFSPHEVLEKAIEAGVKILALTDHDTIEGVLNLREITKAHKHAITLINGIELSARWKKYDIHILGYQINLHEKPLLELLTKQNSSRYERSHQIATCLSAVGVNNAFEKARTLAGHDRIGRPHFAQVLVNEGKVKDMQAAFKRYLGRGKPAYVSTPWISVPEAVQSIIQAGGQAVLAHPLKYRLTNTKLNELIKEFKEAGGMGIEVVSGDMTATEIQSMAGTALRYQLLSSTGSDYHGDISRVSLGRQRQLPLNCNPIWHQWNI